MKLFLFQILMLLLWSLTTAQIQDTWDALGRGVLPFDGTYESTKLRSPVLDLGPLIVNNNKQVRTKTNILFVDNVREEKHTGEGFEEFTRSLQVDTSIGGGFAGFKASAAMHYRFESTQRNDYFFSRTASVVERAHLHVKNRTISNLQSLVYPNVTSYLLAQSPQAIFSLYGTHVATGLIAGGMLELWSSSLKSKFSSKEEFSLSVSASFKKFIKGSASLTTEETRLANKSESVEGLVTKGGQFRAGAQGVENWRISTTTNAQEIKFLQNGTVPIWDLIPNAGKAAEVRNYYELVFGRSSLILKRFESAALGSTPRVPHPQAQIFVPTGWKVVSGGADVQFFGAGQLLTKSYPIVEKGVPVGWMVESKDHLRSDRGQIQAFAVAIWDPFNDWDVIVRQATSTCAPHPRTSASLPTGYTIVGGGGNTLWKGLGNMLTDLFPSSKSQWIVASKDHLKSDPARVIAYAIGLKSRDGFTPRTQIRYQRFGPVPHPNGTMFATSGSAIIGGGAWITKGGVGNMLVRIYPSPDGKRFFAYGKDHLKSDRQNINIYGIEMTGALYVNRIEEVLGLDPTTSSTREVSKLDQAIGSITCRSHLAQRMVRHR